MKKWFYLILFLFFLFFIFIIPFSVSEILNTFNSSSSSINLTGTAHWENISYLKLPKYSTVYSATINLTGYQVAGCIDAVLTNTTQDAENASETSEIDNGAYTVDEDWSTLGFNDAGNQVNGYINYSIPPNVAFATWSLKLGSTSGAAEHWGYCKLSDGSWYQLYYYGVSPDIYPNVTINPDCLSGSVLQFKITLDSSPGKFADFYEEKVIWTTGSLNYTINVTFDVGNDGVLEFNSSLLTTKNKTSDFSSVLTSYLSTCTADSNKLCYVPVNTTGYCGKVELNAIEINYTESPRLSILSPSNYTNQSRLEINLSVADSNLDKCWWTTHNGTNNTKTCGSNITSGIAEGAFINFTYYVNDTSGNTNFSNLVFTFDATSPVINIIEPAVGQEYQYNTSIALNHYTYDAAIGLDACWYNLDLGANVTLTNCGNATFNTSDGAHAVYLYANDTLGNANYHSHNFVVSLTAPAISLNFPSNNSYKNNGTKVYFNYTPSDANGISSCQLWGNWSGGWHKNYTWINPTNETMNSTYINLDNGKYYWNVWCNDTLNYGRFSTNNYTVAIDTVYPVISSGNISITTVAGSQDVNFNVTGYTEINCNETFYSVFGSDSSINNGIENISLSCSALNGSFTVAGAPPAAYNLTVYMRDRAGNYNYTKKEFSTSESTAPPGGGGGGSETIVGTPNWTMTTDTGSKAYSLQMLSESSRNKILSFKNLGTSETAITLTCSGNLCSYIYFNSSQIKLPIGTTNITQINFLINIPENTSSGKLEANIIGKDISGFSNIVTVNVSVGAFGLISSMLELLADPIYLLIALGIWLVSSFILSLILKKKNWGLGVAIILGFMISFLFIVLKTLGIF